MFVKRFALIVSFFFVAYLFTPSAIAIFNKSADIVFACNANEEEHSKHHFDLKFSSENERSNDQNLEYLKIQKNIGSLYQENNYLVYLKVSLPPPKIA